MHEIHKRVLWQCFCRSWCVGAAMSAGYMQRVSFLYALHPALLALYPEAEDLREARRRYLGNVRTHIIMAPLLVGMFIALELRLARKEVPAEGVEGLLHTTATALSAIGDSFFSGSVLVLWALGCFLCFLWGVPPASLENMTLLHEVRQGMPFLLWPIFVWTGFLLALVSFFRVYMFYMGVKHSFAALQIMRRLDFINWAERIKFCNAVLLALIFWHMTDGETVFYWGNELWGLFTLLFTVLLIQRAQTPRLLLVTVLFMILLYQNSLFWV